MYSWVFVPEKCNMHRKTFIIIVHSGFICNSQKSETAKISLNRWTVKQTSVLQTLVLHWGILFSNKKEWILYTCNNFDLKVLWMDLKHIVLSEKSPSPKFTYYNSIYITFSKLQNYTHEKKIRVCQGLRMTIGWGQGGRCGDTGVGWGRSLWWWKILYPDCSGNYTKLCML